MNYTIVITYDPKSLRLVFKTPFHLSDVPRGFPSRRFDPKSKTWRIPLVKSNIAHLENVKHIYKFNIDDAATDAILKSQDLIAAPKHIPFPDHIYDFTKSETQFLPMEHQRRMLNLSWGLKASAWFAKMGTGKTFAAVHTAMARWMAGEIDAVVIICPSTLRRTWMKELKKYATFPYKFKIHDTKAAGLKEFYEYRGRFGTDDGLPILAVSVEGLGVSPALYDSVCGYYTGGRRILTVVDESSRIKNPDAKRTQRTIELGRCSDYRMVLNGTPIALGIQDLWAQYEFLDPNIIGMGDYWAFKTRYIATVERKTRSGHRFNEVIGTQNVEELMNLIIPYTCEVGKDVLDLPPKTLSERYVELTHMQRRLIKLIVKGSDGTGDIQIKVDNTLEKMLRCRQVVGGWLPRARSEWKEIDGIETEVVTTTLEPLEVNPKMDLLMDIIEDNYVGTKFIIWTTFVHEIEWIRDRLAEKYGAESVSCYYGSTAMEDRSAIEDRYCNDGTLRFFVGNPVAAGLGLTLISGESDAMLYYSGTNAYIERAQSEDRSHRIGQTRNVSVIDLVAEKSVDEVIMASIREKMDVEQYVYARIKQGISLDDMLMGEA